MKLGPVTMFALVGWYLMVSPEGKPDTPLTKWRIAGSFDTANSCRDDQAKGVSGGYWNFDQPPLSADADPEGAKMARSACVATDDPRLKWSR
jgi:hypothetical protein